MNSLSIRKTMNNNGRVLHLLMTDGQSEILEFSLNEEKKVDEMIEIMNMNTDSDCVYTKVKIGLDV